MKLSTLAFRNIRRNFKIYVMYFFALSFSVFTAYSFLALLENRYVSDAFMNDNRYRSLLNSFGVIIMVFVVFFLVGSNNSFIRARKKEISTYSLFGMTNGKIGKLLFIETMIVGFAALIVGVGTGVFLSKLVAMVLLDISLASFAGNIEFSIVPKTIYITVIAFMTIFCVMGLSGLRVINKFELVDLFKGHKISEGGTKGSTPILVISLMLVGAGYYLASIGDPAIVTMASIPILILVISGTYLFFRGGLSKILHLIKKNRSRYYKDVNLISTSMFYHRMKSIGSTMATIAVLSAVATTAIATGFTLYNGVEKNTYETVGYDLYFYSGQEDLLDHVHRAFEKHKVKIIEEYTTQRYICSPKIKPIIHNNLEFRFGEEDYFRVYSETVYNKLMSVARIGLKPVHVKPGEAMARIGYHFPDAEFAIAIKDKAINFSNLTLRFSGLLGENISPFGALYTLVLNDSDFDTLLQSGDIVDTDQGGTPLDRVTVFKFEDPFRAKDLNADLSGILMGNVGSYRTAYGLYYELLEVYGLVCFIGFFMSVIFILMTASLLYFKQIMAAGEEQHQYRMLRKIGMDAQTEKKVIAKRLIPVFLIPLAVGITHSIFAMKAADTMRFASLIPGQNSYIIVLSFSALMYCAYATAYTIFYFITKAQYSKIVR